MKERKVHTSLQNAQKMPLAGYRQQNPSVFLEKERSLCPSYLSPPLSGEEEQKVGNFPPWQRPGRRGGLEKDESAEIRFSELQRGYFRPGRGERRGPSRLGHSPASRPSRRAARTTRWRRTAQHERGGRPPPPSAPRRERGRSAGPGAAMAGGHTSSRAPAPAAGVAVAAGSAGGGGEGAQRGRSGALPD